MNFNSLIPELTVKNIDETLIFYIKKLGFKIEYQRPEDKFVFISMGKSQIMLNEDNGHWITDEPIYPRGRGINFQIDVENLLELEVKVNKNNLEYFKEPKEEWYRIDSLEEGVKEFLIQDPDGYLLRFQQYLGQRKI